jgi:hypothetical protein
MALLPPRSRSWHWKPELFNMPDRDGQRRNIRDLERDRLRLTQSEGVNHAIKQKLRPWSNAEVWINPNDHGLSCDEHRWRRLQPLLSWLWRIG